MTRYWRWLALGILIWASATQAAETQKLAGRLKSKQPLVFIAPVDYAPWVINDDKGQVNGGILFEMARTIGEMVGHPIRVKAFAYPRFESLIDKEEYDFTFVNQNQNLRGGILLPKVMSTTWFGLIYQSRNPEYADCTKIRSLAQTNQNSDALSSFILQKCGNLNLVSINSLGQRFKMLGHGRVDAFAGSDEELDLAAWFSESCHSFSINRFFELQWRIFIKESSLLTQDTLRRRIQEFIDTYQSQHYDRIRKKVLGKRYCPRPSVH